MKKILITIPIGIIAFLSLKYYVSHASQLVYKARIDSNDVIYYEGKLSMPKLFSPYNKMVIKKNLEVLEILDYVDGEKGIDIIKEMEFGEYIRIHHCNDVYSISKAICESADSLYLAYKDTISIRLRGKFHKYIENRNYIALER